jgi:hypothetical protein
VEGYFWVFNLVESKNSFRVISGSKYFIKFYRGRFLLARNSIVEIKKD